MTSLTRRPSSIALVAWLVATAAGAAGRAVPIADAARDGDVKAVRVLLQQHADVNAAGPDGTTALHWAADRGDAIVIDLLIRAGAKVATPNRYGVTPLALAAASGRARVVDRLLKAGADPNTTASRGEPVLMTAARMGRTDVVRSLIEAGANVNAREPTRGQTALMWAAAEGHADMIRLLIGHGAEINAVSHGPSSPGDITEGESIYKRVAPRVDVFTPLQFAVQAGHMEAAGTLLDGGGSIKDETPQGMGLVTLAIANAHYDVAALLADRGADVNESKIGWTPLHQIVRMRTLNIGQFPHPVSTGRLSSLDLVKVLLAHGADIDARTKKAWQDGWRGSFGMNATPFILAAKGGDTAMMWLLAANGADVFATNVNGTSALMVAGGIEMFNPNEDSGTALDGMNAAHVALALGLDINGANRNGDTALHGAVHRDNTELIQFLVEHGARLDAKNNRGFNPLQLAVNGVGINNGTRPTAAAVLRTLMRARGLSADAQEDSNRYSFGVQVK